MLSREPLSLPNYGEFATIKNQIDMDKIEKVKEWVKKQKKEELARNSIGVITGKALFVDANELLSFLDTLSEEPDKSLEEAAEKQVNEALFKWSYDDEDGIEQYVYDSFIAGAEWQASQMPMPEDTVLFNKGIAEGRRLEREDMLKDAYNYSDLYSWYIHNVSVYDKPLWSEKHLKELLKDFIVIPKEDNEDGSK